MIINSINYTNNPFLHEKSFDECTTKRKREAFSESVCKSGLTKKNKNEVINSGSFTDMSEAAALSFKGTRFNKFLASDRFSRFLAYTDEHNMTANALVALVTAGIVRPTLTMAIPGMKDKKDKIYSAAQAVSSGFLGYGVTMAVTKPLDDALKKAKENSKKFNCESINKMNSGQMKTMNTLMKNIPEWAICVPRAMLTIALIPFILKYVFGLEKKPKNAPSAEIAQNDFNNLKPGKDMNSFISANGNGQNIKFGAKLPEAAVECVVNPVTNSSKTAGMYDKFTDFIATHISSPLLNSKFLQKKANDLKESEFLFNHVSTVTSAVISGVYMQRTLNNDNLEDDKKKILAINQGLTFVISTTLSYLIDAKLSNWWEKITAQFIGVKADDKDFAENFKKAQKERNDKIKALKASNAPKAERKKLKSLKALDFAREKKLVLPSNIDNLVNGMGILKKMIIIGSIFRLAVPILATPMASWLDEIRQKHAEKQSAKN